MYIQDILHFDKGGKETEVVVSDGVYEVLCYAFPIDAVRTGMTINVLTGYSCSNIIRAVKQHCAVSKLSPYFAYRLIGKVFSKQERIIHVGDLKISLDAYIPNDISDGEYVSFDVQRLDLD